MRLGFGDINMFTALALSFCNLPPLLLYQPVYPTLVSHDCQLAIEVVGGGTLHEVAVVGLVVPPATLLCSAGYGVAETFHNYN